MPLTQEHKDKIKKHLEGKLKACPMCHTDNWALQDEVVAPPTWHPPGPPAPGMPVGGRTGKVMPLVAVCCSNCHLTLFYPWGYVVEALDG